MIRSVLRAAAVALASIGVLGAAGSPAAASEGCANEAVREQQRAEYLPECRGYERVSPAEKNGEEIGPIDDLIPNEVAYQAAAEAPRALFTLDGAPPGTETGALWTPNISHLANPADPWESFPETPTDRFEGYPPFSGRKNNWAYLNPPLTCGVEVTQLPQPESPGAVAPDLAEGQSLGEANPIANIYTENFETGVHTLVTEQRALAPEDNSEPAAGTNILGASTDCSHILFQTGEHYELRLYPESEQFSPAQSLYEWTEGEKGPKGEKTGPRDATILPGGEPAEEVVRANGSYVSPPLNDLTVSGGSTRVFFTARSIAAETGVAPLAQAVYMRVNGEHTIDVSASKTGTPDRGAMLEAAASDGSRVFFLANYGLTTSSSEGEDAAARCELGNNPAFGEGCDLYEYDVSNEELVDLSADTQSRTGDTGGANVRGVVGISEDGSVVYFSASGRLVAGRGGSEADDELISGEKSNAQANVYRYSGGTLEYVATINQEEAGAAPKETAYDALAPAGGDGRQYLAARVSPSGSYALIATKERATSYNNEDRETMEEEDRAAKSNTLAARVGEPAPQYAFEIEQKLPSQSGYTMAELSAKVGDTIDYRITLRDTGEAALAVEHLVPEACSSLTGGASELQPGETTFWTCEHELKADRESSFSNAAEVEVNKGGAKTNIVEGRTVNGVFVSDEQKLGAGAYTMSYLAAKAGETVDYRLTVTNTTERLIGLQGFKDSGCTNLKGGASELAAKASAVWTCERVLETEHSEVSNSASVTSTRPARDVELYEFNAGAGLTCVSCDPTGERPDEPNGRVPFSQAGNGAFLETKVMAIPRNLLSDGRVFFDSFTPLVQSARGGASDSENPYVWAPDGIEGCARPEGCVSILDVPGGEFGTYFLDASENGENVYIVTSKQLAPEDQDGLRDVYDVRVDGGKLYVSPSPGCEANGTSCQPATSNGTLGFGHASEDGGGGQCTGSACEIVEPPPPKPLAPVKVGRHSTKGSSLTLSAVAPAKGKIEVSGSGLKTLKKSVSKAATYTLKISLGPKAQAAVRRHKKIKVKVHVKFVSSTGTSSSTSFTASFR